MPIGGIWLVEMSYGRICSRVGPSPLVFQARGSPDRDRCLLMQVRVRGAPDRHGLPLTPHCPKRNLGRSTQRLQEASA